MIVFVLLLGAVYAFFGCVHDARAEEFGTDIPVSPGYGRKPDIAVDGSDNVYVVWNGVNFAKSADGGETFGDPIDVGNGYEPSVAVDDSDNIHVAWGYRGDIYYAASTDGGSTFTDPTIISDSHGGDSPDIATYEENVYIVWTASYLENLSLDKSINGNGFGTDIRVNSPEDRPATPAIAIGSDETIYVAYGNGLGFGDSDIRVVKSTDQASTFGSSVVVEDGDSMSDPSIAVLDTDKVYVSYWDDKEDLKKARCARSTDGADSFQPSVNVSHTPAATLSGGCDNDIAIHPCGKIFVTWQDDSRGEEGVYFANSTNGGVSFGENFNVNDGPEAAGHPAIGVGSDTQTYIVWEDDRDDGNIFLDKAADATWPGRVTDLQATQVTNTSVTLTWTAPGDNVEMGTASSYDLRYATASITTETWADATQVTAQPVPHQSGDEETYSVSGLSPDTTYYFALKTADEIPNVSPLSNVASEHTLAGEDDDGGGGIPGLQAGLLVAALGLGVWLKRKRQG